MPQLATNLVQKHPTAAGKARAKTAAVSRVFKSYESVRGPVHALADINLDIFKGEFLTVLGPSGCGKSTLLKCIAGLEPITDGLIEVEGKPVRRPPPDLGIVFQRDLLLDWRTIIDNVLINVEFLGLKRKDFEERARALLALFGLDAYERRYPWELSGGMRQRVAICRALIDDPGFLLMDEPFGALDAMTREQMNLELLRIWASAKKTVLLITHSIQEAVFLADRVVVLTARPGRVIDLVDIDLPRPRTIDMLAWPAFGAAGDRIRKHLMATGDLG